jgi:O-methyltransferase
MYSSTIQVLEQLYDKVSIGGFIIIDDWTLHGARTAVIDFRNTRKIYDPIILVGDGYCSYWRKT